MTTETDDDTHDSQYPDLTRSRLKPLTKPERVLLRWITAWAVLLSLTAAVIVWV